MGGLMLGGYGSLLAVLFYGAFLVSKVLLVPPSLLLARIV